MKVLVDTSVWSLALRRRDSTRLSVQEKELTSQLAEAIRQRRVAMIGLIRQELLSGLREQAQFDKVQAALAPFRDEPLETVDYEEAARFYNECRTRGVHCGTVDILICAVAFRREWTVLSNDSGLNRCIEVMESLRKKRAARVRQP